MEALLIECIYLISAMLIETSSRRKHFNILIYQTEKQPIIGPQESMREHIVAANHAMKIADWKTCVNYLFNDKMNNKVNLFILFSYLDMEINSTRF